MASAASSLEYHPASSAVHLLACSIIAFCFARRLTWRHLTLNKICVIAIFLDSWVFVFWGGLVATGIGMSLRPGACLTGIYLCISFYGSSKVLTYLFLADRVYIVWSANNPVSRRKSKIWMLCGVVLLGYVAIFVLMLIYKIGYIREDGACLIGLGEISSITLLVYDCFLNIFLTTLFVWPILRRKLSNPKLRALAKRTCFAAVVALGTSAWNVVFLLLRDGRRLGWVCLASCAFDVTVNAIAICSITQTSQKTHQSEPHTVPPPPPSDNASGQGNSTESDKHQGSENSRKCFLPCFRGLVRPHLSAFSHRHGKHILPFHRRNDHSESSMIDTQDATKSFALSKVGHFAITRDDPTGAMTRKEATITTGDHKRKLTISGEETTMNRRSLSSPSNQDCAFSSKRRDSSRSGFGSRSKSPVQITAQSTDTTRQHRQVNPNIVEVVSILHDTSNFNASTWTNEFDATGTKIEFRAPLDVDEDQTGVVSEGEIVVTTPSPPPPSYHNHQRRRSDGMTSNRRSGVFTLDKVDEHT